MVLLLLVETELTVNCQLSMMDLMVRTGSPARVGDSRRYFKVSYAGVNLFFSVWDKIDSNSIHL